MPAMNLTAGRWTVGAMLLLAVLLVTQIAVVLAAGPDTYAMPQVVGQAATATPFRFLTPTPFVPSTTTTTPAQTAPRAGGVPMELALPALAGGLAAIGGGSFLLFRRKPAR
jgi:hypothetical protein